MNLTSTPTGSHIPKRLGCYEAELHGLIDSWTGYDRILDIGCGEGWYVVGLGRRMPGAEIWGFDISSEARRTCVHMAARNGVQVHVMGETTPALLQELIIGRTLVIVDAEGAEVDILDIAKCPALRTADVLVELHDFLRPGATERILEIFSDRTPIFYEQIARSPGDFPMLSGLSSADQRRALDENRPAEQRWVWLPRESGAR